MPSPFPGMDPYLENPLRWPGFHTSMIVEIRNQLNEQIRPRYAALIEERVYVCDQHDPGRRALIPDVHIRHDDRSGAARIRVGDESMLAVAEPIEFELLDDEIHDSYINIVAADGQRVVTVIELLSPSNKTAGSQGQTSFLKKRREVLASEAHWAMIDLLRDGDRYVPAEIAELGDYVVHTSRSDARRKSRAWPIKLPQQLPAVTIPLVGADEVKLDLQRAFARVWDNSAYDLVTDYSRPPAPPLPAHYAAWADELLRAAGFRPPRGDAPN